MNIWELLEIEPTTDKKAIRRAYAARTRVIHPEDKPEEFKLLRMAYEAALQFAEFTAEGGVIFESPNGYGTEEEVLTGESNNPPAEDQSQEQEESDHSDLLTYFTENQIRQQQRIDTFMQRWEELKNPGGDSEEGKRWKEYLNSEEFRSIQWNPRIVSLIAEEIDDKFFYSTNEMKMWFWEAYGFQADGKDKYQGEQQKLWECLYPAYEYFQKVFWVNEYDRKSKRSFRIFAVWAVFVIFIIISLAGVYYSKKVDDEQHIILQYMAGQYPGTEFSAPERSKEQDTSGINYTLYSLSHPELPIAARVEYWYMDETDERVGVVAHEDYGAQLIMYYAEQYGLDSGLLEYGEDGNNSRDIDMYGVLVYPDIDQVDAFCETVVRMFAEQEELQVIPSVGICAENILFPEVMLLGGVSSFHFGDLQIYDLRAMDAGELASLLRNTYMIYMFQYESWNLTGQQYDEWGAAYEKVCEQWEDYHGVWYDMKDAATGKKLCRIYIPTYMSDSYYYSYNNYITNYSTAVPQRAMTVGNAYYFLLSQDADVTVNEDGSGFTVEYYGKNGTFGTQPEENFNEVSRWYGKSDIIFLETGPN